MFGLIVAIITIALIIAISYATLFYGGPAFYQGTAKAAAAAVINQAEQIAGANTLYANDSGGTFASDPTVLMPSYLRAMPIPPAIAAAAGNSWALHADGSANTAYLTGVSDATCAQVNKAVNFTPATTVQDEPSAEAAVTTQFGCVPISGGVYGYSNAFVLHG